MEVGEIGERVDVHEAQGGAGGVRVLHPGAHGADFGVEVREDGVGLWERHGRLTEHAWTRGTRRQRTRMRMGFVLDDEDLDGLRGKEMERGGCRAPCLHRAFVAVCLRVVHVPGL